MRPQEEIRLYDHIIRIGLCLLAFIVPLLFTPRNQSILLLKEVFYYMGIFGLFFLWILKAQVQREFKLSKSSLILPLILFLWIGILSAAFFSYRQFASMEELARFTTHILFYLLIANHFKTFKQLIWLLVAVVLSASIATGYGLIQQYFPAYDPVRWGAEIFVSTFGNQNFFAGYLVVVTPVAGALAFVYRHDIRGWLLAGLTPLMILCIILSGTRGAWIGLLSQVFVFSLILLFAGKLKIFLTHKKVLVGIIICLLLGGLALPKIVDTKGKIDRFKSIFSLTQGSNLVRVVMWRGVGRSLIDKTNRKVEEVKMTPIKNFIIGNGIGTFQLLFPLYRPSEYHHCGVSHNTLHAHNEYLEVLAEEGVLGILVYLWIFIAFFKEAIKVFAKLPVTNDRQPKKGKRPGKRSRGQEQERERLILKILQIGLLLGIFGELVHNIMSVNLRWMPASFQLWLTMGLALANKKIIEGEWAVPRQKKPEKPVSLKTVNPSLRIGLILLLLVPYFGISRTVIKYYQADRRLKEGIDNINMGKWTMAEEKLNKTLELCPYSLSAYYKLAHVYAMTGQNDKSLETYLALTKLAPNYAQVHYNFGVVYGKTGRIDEAISELKKAINIDSFSADAYNTLAQLYTMKKDYGQALETYDSFLDMPPKRIGFKAHLEGGGGYPTGADYAKVRYGKALLLHQYFQKTDEAIQEIKKAIHLNPDYKDAYYTLAVFYVQKEKVDEAIPLLERVVKIDPQNWQAHTLLAQLFERKKSYKEALEMWNAALKIKPDDANVRRHSDALTQNLTATGQIKPDTG
ncbi:tetratricopeptide repeat protein [bacterium]|nr:tetratricopeptide repeat protein [bacterium]